MQRGRKKYEDLTITDDFMFGKVMHHPERCRKLLEIILDVRIREVVTAAKEHWEWRREYMKLEAMTQRIRWEGREEGEIKKLISQVYRKAVKGKMPEEIAEDLEEDIGEVRRIYDVVAKYLPDYEPEKILEELKGVQAGVGN